MKTDIEQVLESMTLDEKCLFVAGHGKWDTVPIRRLGIPSITFSDGPHGLRHEIPSDPHGAQESEPATCFPTASALACSFDERLMLWVGRALGEEARAADVSVLLGPGINMKRSPLGGRNFEYLSEDPFLAGKLAAAYIRGVQSQGVGACVKHFAANSQERLRMTADSVVDERTLRELYLRAFEIAICEGHPWTVMGAYNRLNNYWCCEDPWLLTYVLRDEWGFDGTVITDWGAENDHYQTLPAGCDLVMPGPYADYSRSVLKAVDDKAITRDELSTACRRILELVDKSVHARETASKCDIHQHLELAQLAAEESAVLLENDGVLPLRRTHSIAVVGAFAKEPRYQGSGSSKVEPIELDNAYDALAAMGYDVAYAPGYDPKTGETTEEQMAQAAALASTREVVVYFMGMPDAYESEGFDRASLDIPRDHIELLRRLSRINPHTVVVLQGGAPMDTSWSELAAAILLMHLSGCQGGQATANLLSGRVNPSGKLAETWPLELEDTPAYGRFSTDEREILYAEGLFTGYRYYDAAELDVAYPFGYGLSYTTFEYSNLNVTFSRGETNYDITVTCTVTNTGFRTGREVVQLYVSPVNPGIFKPRQTLQAFTSVELNPRESKTVTMHLDERSFAHYDTKRQSWAVEEGAYELRVASSSRDIRLTRTVTLAGVAKREFDVDLAAYHHPYPGGFTDKTFRALYGNKFPLEPHPGKPFTRNSTIADLRGSLVGRFIGDKILREVKLRSEAAGDTPEQTMKMLDAMCEMPIRIIAGEAGGSDILASLMDILDGHYLRGIHTLIRGQRPDSVRREKATRNRSRHDLQRGKTPSQFGNALDDHAVEQENVKRAGIPRSMQEDGQPGQEEKPREMPQPDPGEITEPLPPVPRITDDDPTDPFPVVEEEHPTRQGRRSRGGRR